MLRRTMLAMTGALVVTQALADHDELQRNHVAVLGYDVVAYFDGEAIEGVKAISAQHGGKTYYFAKAANRDRFLADADRYAPAFGGFCAYGVRMGQKLAIDPMAYEIVDGRLFLFMDEGTENVWQLDRANNISIADEIWEDLRDEAN